MKNSVKIALGIVTGGVLIFLNQKRRQRKNNGEIFTAPDGNQYKENQMYRAANGEVFRNGKKLRSQIPLDFSYKQNKFDSNMNNQNLNENFNLPKNNVSYHHKGDRHR
ncbi:hypothetical protein [Chryseobacterium sp. GP-SGM7]|uniref:hypothetical protein n=1 Tax=Chryseobacterium sp. GP-SGM7 TaxID=3411323 RepID=UPI003B9522DF